MSLDENSTPNEIQAAEDRIGWVGWAGLGGSVFQVGISLVIRAAITMVLLQDMELFAIIHGRKNLGNHSCGIR